MSTSSMPELEAFDGLVRSRRSVRRFTDEVVPDEVIEQCLELAVLAPNACNLQTWELHVIQDPALRAKVARAAVNQNAARTAPVLIAVAARIDTVMEHSREMLRGLPEEDKPPVVTRFYRRIVPLQYSVGPLGLYGLAKAVGIAAVRLVRPVPWTPVSRRELQLWSVKSAAFAAAHLMLAFKAAGFDSCPMEGFDEGRVRRLLGLPFGARVPVIVAVGKQAPRGIYAGRFRFPLSRSVRWRR